MVLTSDTIKFLMPQQGGYTSCIKINGIPILPPLITETKRLEIQNDKKKAVEIEKRLKIIKKSTHNNNNSTLEHLLSFGSDNNNSHIHALGIPDISKKKLPLKDCKSKKVVPLKNNLTCNIFDVSEYSDKGVVIFNNNDGPKRQLSASNVELDLSDAAAATTYCAAGDAPPRCHDVQIDDFKPRLIRSNSYTLESPSPILLEHFKKQAEHEQEKYLKSPKRRSFDLGNCSRFNTPQRNGCLNNINLDLVQDLAQKHFGDVNQSKINPTNTQVDETEFIEFQEEVVTGIPDKNCAKDIMDFLQRHNNNNKKEQDINLKSYDTFKQSLFDHNINLKTRNNLPKTSPNIEEFDPFSPSPREELILQKQESEIKSIFLFDNNNQTNSSPTTDPLNTSTPFLIDFESDSCDNDPSTHLELFNSTSNNSDPLHVLRGYNDYYRHDLNTDIIIVKENKSPNCSKELFPENPAKRQRKLKEKWAATVLTAAAKGYLVRRLKRTERVKNLIQTIQDALVCAMSLHMESTESIRPPDVELHRRLIQQVSAACFEFHEVFFNLTTKEQMALISADRQRLKEKLKRPKSSSSLKLDSSRSTPNSSQRQSFNNMRQKKTLTPSFAA